MLSRYIHFLHLNDSLVSLRLYSQLLIQRLMKPKSRSRDLRDHIEPLTRYAASRHSPQKDQRLIRTAQYRNHSNQYAMSTAQLPVEHPLYRLQAKHREHSSSKKQRKESKMPSSPTLEHRKNPWNKTFIGSKLKKKLLKYLLLIKLVNFSLRSCHLPLEIKRYKLFVGKGNNSKIVKTVFSQRFWWSLTSDQNEANLVWTQKANKKTLARINQVQNTPGQGQIIDGNIAKRKLKTKKNHHKGVCFDEDLEGVLCEKDKHTIKNELKKQTYLEDLKNVLKKFKPEKRSPVMLSHNHIQHHQLLTNKKNLYHNLKRYCEQLHDDVFHYVPLTFHLTGNEQEYQPIVDYQESTDSRKEKQKLLWIVKPGENSNRGCGIEVCKRVEQVKKHIQKQKQKHPLRTFIVQKYVNPCLFHRRKFDIRCFALVTATPHISGYFYPVGYIRTSSYEFSIKNCTNKYIHLTNDAVQKKANQYSKYEVGNKVRFEEFQAYLDLVAADKKINFFTDILPALKDLVGLSIRAANNFRNTSKQHTFQILGYDFMIDEDMQPWLIEINTNPCLQTNCDILADIIPNMLENAVKIAVDTVFRPPKMQEWALNDLIGCSDRLLASNRFELVYSQLHEQP